MKIRLLSDLHLEGFPFKYEFAGEDVLVLAGDIHTRKRHHSFISQVPEAVKIVMVAGNHEYYDEEFDEVNDYLYKLQYDYVNFYFLNNRSIDIDGVSFYGGPMFTNWNVYGDAWTARQYAKNGISDFSHIFARDIKGEKRVWSVEDHFQEHVTYLSGLEEFLKKENDRKVVISHFVPHPKCSDPKYAGSLLNPYFISDMSNYIGFKGLWLYGHTHCSLDNTIGETRLLGNPKGYGNENPNFNPNFIVEI